jgi:hypothetical protein
MTDRIPGIDFPQLLAEGLMVVASILVAFALDAWWDERQLEQEMLEDLAVVEAELAENVRLVNQTIEIMIDVTEANTSLINEMKASPEAGHIEVPGDQVFWALFFNPTLDLSMGAIDAWIAAGRLAGIDNPDLRKRLASVRGKVADVTEEQGVARLVATRDIYPMLGEEIGDITPIYELFVGGYHARPNTGVIEIPELAPIAVPVSNRIRFALQSRTLWYGAAIIEMMDFKAELEAIQALLRDEIGEQN